MLVLCLILSVARYQTTSTVAPTRMIAREASSAAGAAWLPGGLRHGCRPELWCVRFKCPSPAGWAFPEDRFKCFWRADLNARLRPTQAIKHLSASVFMHQLLCAWAFVRVLKCSSGRQARNGVLILRLGASGLFWDWSSGQANRHRRKIFHPTHPCSVQLAWLAASFAQCSPALKRAS